MNTEKTDFKKELNEKGFTTSTGPHGDIFVTPVNMGNVFMKKFDTAADAYTYYSTNPYFASKF